MPDAKGKQQLLMMEFCFGLAEFSQISKKSLEKGVKFKDMMSGIINFKAGFDDENGN